MDSTRINVPTVVITHHSASAPTTTVNQIDAWHKLRWPGFVSRAGYHVGYHYVIDHAGKVTQTREHDEEGAHTRGMNLSSIGVCFTGNFNETKPTYKQLRSWFVLWNQIKEQYPNIVTMPHRAYSATDCHGKLLQNDYFVITAEKASLLQTIEALLIKIQNLLTKSTMK